MSKFKVGDIVRRIHEANTWESGGVAHCLPVGTVCRVTYVTGAWLATPTETWPSHTEEHGAVLSHEDNFELVDAAALVERTPDGIMPFNYMYGHSRGAQRKRLVACTPAVPIPLAARAVAGGLQQHSVGGTYPLHPVAIANGDRVYWEVHNLQDDTVLCDPYFDSPCMYSTVGEALNFILDRAEGVPVPPDCGSVWLKHPRNKPPRRRELTPREEYYAAMEQEVDHV